MRLKAWAEAHGVDYRTALKWYHDGDLLVLANRVGKTILVGGLMPVGGPVGVAVYARVSSSGQSAGLDRQVVRLTAWAAEKGLAVLRVVSETGSGLNGKRRKLMWLLADLSVGTVVVEHRDRLARFGFEMVEASFVASGRELLVVDDDELDDDLVRDVTEVLTSVCVRLCGRRAVANRAMEAATHG